MNLRVVAGWCVALAALAVLFVAMVLGLNAITDALKN